MSLVLPIIPARANPAPPYQTATEMPTRPTVASAGVSITDSATGTRVPARPNDASSIRPFHYHASDSELADLRQRISMTKWPARELVADSSQGVQLATIQELARYWQLHYDWRKFETRLDALPQFVTTIDGVEIHFIHVRSKHPKALPIIITHGWPGSIIEQLKVIDPLTNPTAHGGTAADAFDVVIPSLPGHGFSGKPTDLGWDPIRIARAWIILMKQLGYTLTNTAVSSARLYWESKLPFFAPKGITIPVAVSAYPDEIYTAPRSWTERAYPQLIHYNRLPEGGHFAAWEQPESFSEELRVSFRSLR